MRGISIGVSRLIGLSFALVLLLGWGTAQKAFAQGCGNWMTPKYSTYINYSTDGTYIYTSVTVNGTTTGNCPFGCDTNCSSTTHTPRAYNVIGGKGGWENGSPAPWNYEINEENDQKITATVGTQYKFSSEGEVICSEVGVFYLTNVDYDYVLIWDTTAKLHSDMGGGICATVDACLGGATPLCGVGDVFDGNPCLTGWLCKGIAFKELPTDPLTCFPAAVCTYTADVPGMCDPTR